MKANHLQIGLTLFFFCMITFNAFSQDTLHLKNGEVYITKVIVVGTEEISYKLFNEQNGPTYELKKNKIMYIALSSGTILNFSSTSVESKKQMAELGEKVSNKKNAFKWELLAPLTNDLCFGYERYITNNQSIEVKAAVIGVGNDRVEDSFESSGYFVKLGYKFVNSKNPLNKSMYGSYVKPEVSYSEFSVNSQNFKSKYFAVNFGLQSVLMSYVVIEIYGGVGLAYNEVPDQTIFSPYYYNFERDYFYSNTSLANSRGYASCFTGGLILSYHF